MEDAMVVVDGVHGPKTIVFKPVRVDRTVPTWAAMSGGKTKSTAPLGMWTGGEPSAGGGSSSDCDDDDNHTISGSSFNRLDAN